MSLPVRFSRLNLLRAAIADPPSAHETLLRFGCACGEHFPDTRMSSPSSKIPLLKPGINFSSDPCATKSLLPPIVESSVLSSFQMMVRGFILKSL